MFELRILNGLKSGISFPITEEALLIGDADDSDILMLDRAFFGANVSVRQLSDNTIDVNFISGSFTNSLGEIVEGEHLWSTSDSIHMGGIVLNISETDSIWPEEIPQIEKSVLPVEVKEEREEIKEIEEVKTKKSSKWLITACVCVSFLSIWGGYNLSYAMLPVNGDEPSFADTSFRAQFGVQLKPDYELDIRSEVNFSAKIIESPMSALDNNSTPQSKTLLSEEMPKEMAVDSAINYKDIIDTMLKQRDIDAVSLEDNDGVIHLKGILSDMEKRVLKRMIARYNHENPDGDRIQNDTISFAESFPINITSVVSGPYGHILLSDGTRLSLGQAYKGYQLLAINRSSVEFKGKTKVVVDW